MKKHYISLAVALLVTINLSLIAQPILTGPNTNPQIGETYKLYDIDVSSFDEGNSGANVTWDFSSLDTISSSSFTYLNPSTTPYYSSFPNSTVASGATGSYEYNYTSTTEFRREGLIAGTTIMAYSDPQTFLEYPFTYNSSFVDNFS